MIKYYELYLKPILLCIGFFFSIAGIPKFRILALPLK
jgi:hypothetical protein